MATREKLEFVFAMAKHSNATLHDCQRIMRYAVTYHRFAEECCNRELSIAERDKWGRVQFRIMDLCGSFGAKAKCQNDPRGTTVKVVVPDGYTNDWGNEGICVPIA